MSLNSGLTVNSISIRIPPHVMAGLELEDVGIIYLLTHAIAGGYVDTYSPVSLEPSIPSDIKFLARICCCSSQKMRKKQQILDDHFIVDAGTLKLRDPSWIHLIREFRRTPINRALREEIFERDGSVCRYCGATEVKFHIDHIVPVVRGGSDHPHNLCVACGPCNLSKGDKLLEEWQQ